jgi:hypothetical protein
VTYSQNSHFVKNKRYIETANVDLTVSLEFDLSLGHLWKLLQLHRLNMVERQDDCER